jgi:hypothetical protein
VHSFEENSIISNMLCASIPEEEEEESKNSTVTIAKMQEEIEGLKTTITLTQQSYNKEKEYLYQLIKEKDNEVMILGNKLQKLPLSRLH